MDFSSLLLFSLVSTDCYSGIEWNALAQPKEQQSLTDRITSFEKSGAYADYKSHRQSPEEHQRLVAAVLNSKKHKAYLEEIVSLKEQSPSLLQYRLPGPWINLQGAVAYADVQRVFNNAGYKVVGDVSHAKRLETDYFGEFPKQPSRVVVMRNDTSSPVMLLIDKNQVFGISVYDDAATEIERNHGNNVRAYRVLNLLDSGGLAESIKSYRHSLKAEEERTIKRIRNPNNPKVAERLQAVQLQKFFDEKDAILIVTDIHSQSGPLKTFEALAEFSEVSWLGVELSERYERMFKSGTQDRDLRLLEEPIKPGDQRREIMQRRMTPAGEFYSTWDALRRLQQSTQKPIHFLDTDEYTLTGKDMLGLLSLATGVRNDWMAKKIPEVGRGVILIGQGHVEHPFDINLQDFISDRFPGRKVFILE